MRDHRLDPKSTAKSVQYVGNWMLQVATVETALALYNLGVRFWCAECRAILQSPSDEKSYTTSTATSQDYKTGSTDTIQTSCRVLTVLEKDCHR